MTIGTAARVQFNCDGVTTVFPLAIQAYQAIDITVILTSSTGIQSTLSLNSDYSLVAGGTLQPQAWTMTTLAATPYAAGNTLQAFINPSVTQQSQYVQGQAFPSLAIQTNVDRLTQMVQRLQDQVSRAIRAPDGDIVPGMLLPPAVLRPSQYLATDGNGNILTTVALPGTANTAASLGPILNPLTAAEISAGVTPVNFAFNPGWVTRFGVDTSGVLDSTTAFQHALNAAAQGGWFSASGGATVTIPSGAILYIASNLTIPANVTVKGPQSFVGAMTSNSMSAPYQTMGGQISLASTATITMDAGSCLDGLLIVQHGLTFPQTNPNNYSGTAITYNGDDCTVKNCMILAFNQGITSSGFQRPKCFDCLMDNKNGISFTGSEDITHIERVHMWNFGTFYPAVPAADLQRSGTGIAIVADGSGAKVIDCFTYGYNTGFATNGIGDVANTFLNCWADNTASGYGTGYAITGGATDTKLTACMASGCVQGYLFSLNSGLKATMTDCNSWGNGTHGILSATGNAGDIIIRGGYLRNNPNAITYANTGGVGILDVDEVSFDSTDSTPFSISVASTTVYIGKNNDFGNFTAGTGLISTPTNVQCATVASASSVNLPYTGDTFNVSGTTAMGTVNGGWAGREVTLIFAGILTFGSSTGAYSAVRLSGGSNFITAANSSLTIRHNGVQWYEIGRAA